MTVTADNIQRYLHELLTRLKRVSPRIWAVGVVLVLLLLFLVTRCDGDDGSEHLVVADARGNIYALDGDSSSENDLEVDQRIGRSLDLPDNLTGLESIDLLLDDASGEPQRLAARLPMIMTSSGHRLTLLKDRRAGLRIERGAINDKLGEAEEIASGELSSVTYYLEDDVLYFEERVTSGTRTCYLARSGGDPERIGTGDTCSLWPVAELVVVRTSRNIKLFDYSGEERLQLDLRNYFEVDLVDFDDGRSIAATRQSGDGLTELVVISLDGEETFVTRNDRVDILSAARFADVFIYSEQEAGETPQLWLWNDGDSTFITEGQIMTPRFLQIGVAPDGSAAFAAVIAEDDIYEVWFADFAETDDSFELIYEAYVYDIYQGFARWVDSADTQLLLTVEGVDARDSVAEIRSGSDIVTLEPSSSELSSSVVVVPVGDSFVSFSGQSDQSGSFVVLELLKNNEVTDIEILDGRLAAYAVVDDRTLAAVTVDNEGLMFLMFVSLDGDEFEIVELMAASRVHPLVAISGRVYAQIESLSGLEEVVTAKPGDTSVEYLSDVAEIVGVLSRDLSLYSWD